VWGFIGATVVAEVAYQLLKEKERVNFIGLLDGWGSFSSMQTDGNYVRVIMERLQQDNSTNVLPKGIENEVLWEELLQHRLTMMLNHPLKKITAKLSLFKASEILLEYQEINAEDNHWSAYSSFPIDLYPVPGNHNSMLQEPNSIILAKYVQECLSS
jgi:polyketide synthase PksJ